MSALQGRNDTLGSTQQMEGLQGLLIGGGGVANASLIPQESVLRPHRSVVQACRDGVGLGNLSVLVLQHVGVGSLEDPRLPAAEARRVITQVRTATARLDSHHGHRFIFQEGMEEPDGIAAPSDTGHQGVRQSAFPFQNLLAGLPSDHRLKVSHHHGVRMGAENGTDQVVGAAHVGDPVPNSLVDGVLQGLTAAGDPVDLGSQQAHAEDVQRLPPHVFLAHVDLALQVEQSAHGGGGDAVLSGPGFGDDPLLAHPFRQ